MLTDESLLVKHNTRLSCHLDDATVLLSGIDCTGLDADEVENFMPGIDVAFQFNNSEGAFPIHSLPKLSLMPQLQPQHNSKQDSKKCAWNFTS